MPLICGKLFPQTAAQCASNDDEFHLDTTEKIPTGPQLTQKGDDSFIFQNSSYITGIKLLPHHGEKLTAMFRLTL